MELNILHQTKHEAEAASVVNDKGRKRLPPYVSYRTFRNFFDGLQQGIPARIDRSYWSDRLSGSTGIQLMAALRFLGLVDANGIPTNRLRQLAAARGTQRAEVLRQMTNEAYAFLLQETFETQTATYSQLEECFHRTFELTGDVSRKCIKFFVALASDAGVPLSPFITKRLRSGHTSAGTKPVVKKRISKTIRNVTIPQELDEFPAKMPWDKMLLAKFPNFDPAWTDEVKLGWFQAFDELKFPTFDPAWPDEVKVKWFEAFDEMLRRGLTKGKGP